MVDRYDCEYSSTYHDSSMEKRPDGDWVRSEDYDALLVKLDEVDKARSEDAKALEKRLEDAYARNRSVTAERDAALIKLDEERQYSERMLAAYQEAHRQAMENGAAYHALASRLSACLSVLEWGRPFDGESEFFKRMEDALAPPTNSGPISSELVVERQVTK